jgi:excisionase family DNA binding protein
MLHSTLSQLKRGVVSLSETCYHCGNERKKSPEVQRLLAMPVLDAYLNVVEAAAVLGVHWETVKRLCREGRIPAEKVHNTWLIHKEKLERFAANYDPKAKKPRRSQGA